MLRDDDSCRQSMYDQFHRLRVRALDTAELYTQTGATTGTFSLAGVGSGMAMTAARNGATATSLADGVSVLITGGASGSSFLGSAAPPPDAVRQDK